MSFSVCTIPNLLILQEVTEKKVTGKVVTKIDGVQAVKSR